VSDELRTTARALAARTYRKIGAAGRRLLGDRPEATATAGAGTEPPDEPAAAPAPAIDIDVANPPWAGLPDLHDLDGVFCNICRWRGEAFTGGDHVEHAHCPSCGSNGRDRFVHWCLTERVGLHPGLRVIECSPRLGSAYRSAMATWFFYRTSDYDMRAHEGKLHLDLQAIDLPDACLDVVICSHVLEHVPHTDRALRELRRVIAPGGHLLLQVPVLQGRTAPPTEPEFHDDHTPVFWRFGFDLTARLRGARFTTTLLATSELADAVRSGGNPWAAWWSGEFDVPGMLAEADADDMVVVADHDQSARLGVQPGYMHLTWHCQVPEREPA
jgi:SAM-dependent methyltransferase